MSQNPTYSPELLELELKRAGLGGWKRFFQLLFIFVAFAFGFWADSRAQGPEAALRHRRRAIWLREQFVILGSTFVKIGQVLSTRPDLLPLPYVEEMAVLQDRVPPFDSELAHRIIREELGRPVEEVFSILNPLPLAAASIGQVYKAKLVSGREVVVKVQRPGLIPTVCLDLGILRRITAFVDRHPKLSRGMPYTAILDEFGLSMFDQADYTTEGRFAERFRENFKHFPGIRTPVIHWEYTTSRVMVMDFVHGIKVTDLVELEEAGISFREVVNLGVRSCIKMLLEDGFFHADMHPGNLFVDRETNLVFIDFGMVGELSPYMQEKIVDVFLHSVHRQYPELVQDFIDLGFLNPSVDQAALVPVATAIFQAQYGEADSRMSVKEIFAKVSAILYEHPFRIPEKIALLLRTIITLEGIIHKLIPDYKFLETAAPYAAKILLTDAKASIREKLVDELFFEGEFRPDRLAKLFGTATKEPTFRFGEVAPSVLRYLTSPEGGRVREGLMQAVGKGTIGGGEFSWQVYVEKAASDPSWSVEDLALPVLQFLRTEEGMIFLIKLMDSRELMLGANGNALASVGVAFKGRTISDQVVAECLETLNALLTHEDLRLQPVVERLTAFWASTNGQELFYRIGQYMNERRTEVGGRFVPILEKAARHPHLDIAPLVREFLQLVLRPEGQGWQELMLFWMRANGAKSDGVLAALQPLFADGRLRMSELAMPTVGFIFSKDGGALRDELLTTMRGHLAQLNFGGMAQDLWAAAGSFWNQLRGNAQAPGEATKVPVPVRRPEPVAPPDAKQLP
ncbi:putative protein kinase UbiB [compost metagenome]